MGRVSRAKGDVMRIVPLVLLLGLAPPALAQSANPPASTAEDEPIVIRGLADGATVVAVDFDKVWKSCAECKRALNKLDKLSARFREERNFMRLAQSGPAGCPNVAASPATTFQRSSADRVGERGPTMARDIAGELCAARAAESTQFTQQAIFERDVVPAQAQMLAHTRAFLDQLAPHVAAATEAERVARGASAGLTDRKRTKLSAKNIKRIDVTDAVIRRLDAMDFTIALPDPPPPGPASGYYDGKLTRAKTKGD